MRVVCRFVCFLWLGSHDFHLKSKGTCLKRPRSGFLSVNLPPSLYLRQGHPRLNQVSASCHTPSPFRKTVRCSNGSWVFILMLHNEEGHCRKVAVGKTSGRNKFPRIKGLRVQPRGSSGCSSEQTNNSLDESLQFFSAKIPHVLQDLKEKWWSKEREGKLKKATKMILKRS